MNTRFPGWLTIEGEGQPPFPGPRQVLRFLCSEGREMLGMFLLVASVIVLFAFGIWLGATLEQKKQEMLRQDKSSQAVQVPEVVR